MGLSDITREEIDGARSYSPNMLKLYDLWVLGFNNHLVWRCPTARLLQLYNANVGADHLDLGPGTGWFLRRAHWPTDPRVTLVDLSEHSLAMTTSRLQQRGIMPIAQVGSVLRELPVERRRYTSAAASLLMHCVPGGWDSKGVAFTHVADALADEGVFFGSTVLSVGVPDTWLSRAISRAFNQRGMFHNQDDDLSGLHTALSRAFGQVDIQVRGSMALWTARHPYRVH